MVLFFLIPIQAHAETKEHRQCILKAVTERKASLKQIKHLKNAFLDGVENTTQTSIAKEISQFDSGLKNLKQLRNENIQKTKEHADLVKIRRGYIQNIERLKKIREEHIQTIQTEYKNTTNDTITKYKKYRMDTWNAFVKAKDLCAKR